MQSLFQTYLKLGFEHIADLGAYDHILFIVALCAIYKLSQWKQVAILVTAFTIGHSVTLALAVLDIIRFKPEVIEFLIPITIILTAVYNIIIALRQKEMQSKIQLNYLFALGFGLIHGMGFSNFLRSILMPDEEGQLVQQLFAFNVGIELGQLLIVAFILIVSYLALSILKIQQKYWAIGVSLVALIMAVNLLM